MGCRTHWNATGNLVVADTQGETDGSNAIAFSNGNRPSNGVISQSIATTAGLEYSFNFDFGKFSFTEPFQFARLDVDVFDGAGFAGVKLLDRNCCRWYAWKWRSEFNRLSRCLLCFSVCICC